MTEDGVIDLDHRREGALAEAGHRAQRGVAVRCGDSQDFRLAVLAGLQPEAHHHRLQQIARTAGVAGGAAADADGVAALRLEAEQRVERDHAEDPGQGGRRFRRDILKHRRRQIMSRLVLLDFMQNAQQSAGPAGSLGNHRVDECLVEILGWLHGDTLHGSSPRLTRSRMGRIWARTEFRSGQAGPRGDWALELAMGARDFRAGARHIRPRTHQRRRPHRAALVEPRRKRRAATPRVRPKVGDAARTTPRHYAFSPNVHRPHRC